MAVGQELPSILLSELIHKLARAFAEAQIDLDRNAIETLQFLADPKNSVEVVTEVTDVISPYPTGVIDPRTGSTIPYTGATVSSSFHTRRMSLFQAGVTSPFYDFTEATIEVKLSISTRGAQVRVAPAAGAGESRLLIYASPVDYRTASTYSYPASGASAIKTIIKKVPPPNRATPRTVTVDTLGASPRVGVAG